MNGYREFAVEADAIYSHVRWIRLGWHPSSIFTTSTGTWAFHLA